MSGIKQISPTAFIVPSYSTSQLVGVAPYTGAASGDSSEDDSSDDRDGESDEAAAGQLAA